MGTLEMLEKEEELKTKTRRCDPRAGRGQLTGGDWGGQDARLRPVCALSLDLGL